MVVLPCVPAIAMPCFRRISSASISARGTTGMRLRARAAMTSGLSSATAVDVTTASAPAMCAGVVADADADAERLGRWRVAALSAWSEPDTRVAEVVQDLGDAAHAGAADADEVDVFDGFVLHAALGDAPGSVFADSSATRAGGPSLVSRRSRHAYEMHVFDFVAHRLRFAPVMPRVQLRQRGRIGLAQREPLAIASSFSRDAQQRALRRELLLAARRRARPVVARCASGDRRLRQRHQHAATPAAHSSLTVMRRRGRRSGPQRQVARPCRR